jgi:hypothetical protein
VLRELTVAKQRFNAVMEVLRDGLTVVEVADRYGVTIRPRGPLEVAAGVAASVGSSGIGPLVSCRVLVWAAGSEAQAGDGAVLDRQDLQLPAVDPNGLALFW